MRVIFSSVAAPIRRVEVRRPCERGREEALPSPASSRGCHAQLLSPPRHAVQAVVREVREGVWKERFQGRRTVSATHSHNMLAVSGQP